MKLADLVPGEGWNHINKWIRGNLVKKAGDTQWREPTEVDWYVVHGKMWLYRALKAGRFNERKCTYRQPKRLWYGDKLRSSYDPLWGGLAVPGHLYVRPAQRTFQGKKVPMSWIDYLYSGPRAYWHAA